VSIIVHERDTELFVKRFLDSKATRRTDILEIDFADTCKHFCPSSRLPRPVSAYSTKGVSQVLEFAAPLSPLSGTLS
jgi:hypothetical protein